MNKKQIFINMFAQTFSFIITIGINFILTPFVVSNIGIEAYGFIGLGNDFVGYASLFTIALNAMAARFITIEFHKKNIKKSNQYFSSILVANILMSAFFIIPSSLLIIHMDRFIDVSENIFSEVQLLWMLVFINFFVSIVTSVYNTAVFVKNRLDLSSLISIESNLIRCGILFLSFYLFAPHIWYLGLASICSTVFMVYKNIIYTKQLLPELFFSFQFFSFKSIQAVFAAGIWNLLIRLSQIIFKDLNLLMINLLIDANSMGIMAITRIVPKTILSVFSIMSSAFAPQLTISYARNSFEDIREQLFLSIKVLGFFSAIPLCVIWTIGDEFFQLWMPEQANEILYWMTSIACSELIFLLPLECLWNVFIATNRLKIPSVYLLAESIVTIGIIIFVMPFISSSIHKLTMIVTVGSVISIIRSLTAFPFYGALCLKFKWNTFYPLIAKNAGIVLLTTVFFMHIKTFFVIITWLDFMKFSMGIIFVSFFVNFYFLLNNIERKKVIERLNKYLHI